MFADPRAKVCFGSVFLEGIFIHGVFPYVALLLLANGEASATIAGLVIASFGLGGVVYSILVSVLVANIAQRWLMIIGGCVAAAMLVLIALNLPWYLQIGVYGTLGFGFYLTSRLDPRACDRALPHRARRRDLAAFEHVLSRPGARPDLLRLRLLARRGSALEPRGRRALVIVAVGLVCARAAAATRRRGI